MALAIPAAYKLRIHSFAATVVGASVDADDPVVGPFVLNTSIDTTP